MEKYTILYDITIIPENLSLEDVMKIKEMSGIIFYDGHLGRSKGLNIKPEVIEEECKIQTIDISSDSGYEFYQRIMEAYNIPAIHKHPKENNL